MSTRPRLVRPRTMVIAGVSSALADHLRWPVLLVRWIFIGTTPVGGAGVLLYLWLWAFVPVTEPSSADDPVTRERPVAAYLLGAGVVVGIVAVVLANVGEGWPLVTAIAAVLVGAAAAWTITIDATDPARREQSTLAIRMAAAVALVVLGMLLLLAREARPDAVTAVFAVVMVISGVGVLLAPADRKGV